MARLFTMNISYQQKDYPAILSIYQKDEELHCKIHYIDKQLQYIVPGDCLVYNHQKGLQQPPNIPDELAKSLERSTAAAVSEYLKGEQISKKN